MTAAAISATSFLIVISPPQECLYWLSARLRLLPVIMISVVFGPECGITARNPTAYAIESGVDHPFGNVDIIQLISDFKFDFLGNNDFTTWNALRFQNI